MVFRDEELIFLQKIIKADKIFGVFLKYPQKEDERQIVSGVRARLIEKGLISENNKFTSDGLFCLKLLENYCKAKHHLLIGQNIVAFEPKEKAIMISKVKEGYEVLYTDRRLIMEKILKTFEFLRSDAHDKERFYPEKQSFMEWIETMQKYTNNSIVMGRFENGDTVDEQVFYWDEDMGYVYSITNQTVRKADARIMRMLIMKMLDINYADIMKRGVM